MRAEALTARRPEDVAIAHMSLLELAPPELVSCAAAAGFCAVNMRLSPAREGETPYPMAPGSPMLRETLARMNALGVRVDNVEVIRILPQTDPAAHEPLFERAALLGANSVIVVSADPDAGRATASLAALCSGAAAYGLELDLEFMRFTELRNLPAAVEMVRASGARNARVLPDVLHIARCGDDPADLAGMADLVGLVQLCDAPAAPPADLLHEARFARLLPGEGELPVQAVLRALPPDVRLAVESPLDGTRGLLPPLRRAQLTFDAVARLLAGEMRGGG